MNVILIIAMSICSISGVSGDDQMQNNLLESIRNAINTSEIVPEILKNKMLVDINTIEDSNNKFCAVLTKMPTEENTDTQKREIAVAFKNAAEIANTSVLKGIFLACAASGNHSVLNDNESKQQFMQAIEIYREEILKSKANDEMKYFHSCMCEIFTMYLSCHGKNCPSSEWEECIRQYIDFIQNYPEYSVKTTRQHIIRWLKLLGNTERYRDLKQIISLLRASWQKCLQEAENSDVVKSTQDALAQLSKVESTFKSELEAISSDE